jgi:hypothetical protein
VYLEELPMLRTRFGEYPNTQLIRYGHLSQTGAIATTNIPPAFEQLKGSASLFSARKECHLVYAASSSHKIHRSSA